MVAVTGTSVCTSLSVTFTNSLCYAIMTHSIQLHGSGKIARKLIAFASQLKHGIPLAKCCKLLGRVYGTLAVTFVIAPCSVLWENCNLCSKFITSINFNYVFLGPLRLLGSNLLLLQSLSTKMSDGHKIFYEYGQVYCTFEWRSKSGHYYKITA
jgi:hypothetical protein